MKIPTLPVHGSVEYIPLVTSTSGNLAFKRLVNYQQIILSHFKTNKSNDWKFCFMEFCQLFFLFYTSFLSKLFNCVSKDMNYLSFILQSVVLMYNSSFPLGWHGQSPRYCSLIQRNMPNLSCQYSASEKSVTCTVLQTNYINFINQW